MSVRRFAARVLLRALAASLMFATLAMPGTARSQTPNEVCSAILPMGVVSPPDADGFLVGCEYHYLLKIGPPSPSGNFGFVDYPPCDQGACAGMPPTGSATSRCLMANGYGCCLQVGQVVATEPSNAYGPFLLGLVGRWDADFDQREGICFADYTGNGQRVLVAPVTTPFENGRSTVTILGFAAAFLVNRPSAGISTGVEVEFLPPNVVPTRTSSWGQLKTQYR